MRTPNHIVLLLFIAILAACGSAPKSDQAKFMDNLRDLCGNSYPGEVIQPQPAPEGFTDPMVAHITDCGENYVNIPFHIGDNETRTWMLTQSEGALLFKHDHRNPDGTPDGLTNYGGWASDLGSEFRQSFPADPETIAMRDGLESHTWRFEFSEDLSTLSYSLYLYDDLYFLADFDLTEAI